MYNNLADFLLGVSSMLLLFYCVILNFKLRSIEIIRAGIKKEMAGINQEIEMIRNLLNLAQTKVDVGEERLRESIIKAETYSTKLELLIASLHDIPHGEEREIHNTVATNEFLFKRNGNQ